jgi:glutathione transport system ATP-binding protein
VLACRLVTRFPVRSGIFGRVTHRVHAVEQVSFELQAGETLALVGESGCGKSTTGRSLQRLVEATSGRVAWPGRDIGSACGRRAAGLRRDIQFIFQDPFASLDPRLTVGFSIMEPLLVHKHRRGPEAQERVAWLLEQRGPAGPSGAALSARVLRRPAPAHVHRARAGAEPEGGDRRRVGVGARRVDPAQIINLLLALQRDSASPSCSSRTTWPWSSASATAWP